jgi:hypothetical protein
MSCRNRPDPGHAAAQTFRERSPSTDHNRQKVFDKKSDARPVCHELRSLCPRNAEVNNIEATLHDLLST